MGARRQRRYFSANSYRVESPSGKREVDMWNVAAGCLAVAGIISREPGLTLAGLLIWGGRASLTRDTRAPEQPIDSLLQARRSLISLAIALLILGPHSRHKGQR